MDFLKQNKVAIGVGVLLLAGLYVYMTYFTSPSTATLTTSSTDSTISQNLLTTLQSLHTIKLDDTIFTDSAFLSLTDFGVTIPAETVGRRNPFAPLGGGIVPAQGGVTVPLPQTGSTR